MAVSIHMKVLLMGDSWSVGCWRTLNNRNRVYHRGITHYLESAGHSVEVLGQGGSHNPTQLRSLQSHSQLDHDLIVWIWTDAVREYDWWHEHGSHNLYNLHRDQELWVQHQINEWQPDLWRSMRVVGGNAPLYTDWPCEQLSSWCHAMGHIWLDHPTIDPVNWRDYVNWCNGVNTVGRLDFADSPQFNHVHELWWSFIEPFTHKHKAHHMEFLQRSQDRQSLLVHGAEHDQHMMGMMGEDLHPNPKAHEWLTNWVLGTCKND